MTKKHKRLLGISLGTTLTLATVVPASLSLVSCASETSQTNSKPSTGTTHKPSSSNKPSNNKPSTNKPGSSTTTPSKPGTSTPAPSKPTPPPVSNIKFSSTQIQTIYNTVKTSLDVYKNHHQLDKLTSSYLNSASNQNTLLQKIKTNLKLNKNLNQSIQKIEFKIDRYTDSINFVIHFFDKAIPTNLKLPHISYGNDNKDKNSLVMTYDQMGISMYLGYDEIVIMNECVQTYVQNLYDKDIGNINQDTLNWSMGAFYDDLIAHGFNTNILNKVNGMFGPVDVSKNEATYYNSTVDGVIFGSDCKSGPTWTYDPQYHGIIITWHGDLSPMFSWSRCLGISINLREQITALAMQGYNTINSLKPKINTSSFSQLIWKLIIQDSGFAFPKNFPVSKQPRIYFDTITTGVYEESKQEGFFYNIHYTIPAGIPIEVDFKWDAYVNDWYTLSQNKDGSVTFKTKHPFFAPFVATEDDWLID